jgi:hypothetical protein
MALGGLIAMTRPPLPRQVAAANESTQRAGPGNLRQIMNRFLWPLIGFVVLVVPARRRPQPQSARRAIAAGRQTGTELLVAGGSPERKFGPEGHEGQGVAAQRLGVVVRFLPCRNIRSSSNSAKNNSDPAGRPQLQGSARRRRTGFGQDSMPPTRNAKLALERANAWLKQHGNPYRSVGARPRRPRRHRLRRLWRAGNLRHRQGRHHPHEAHRADHALMTFPGKILPLVAELNK